MMPIQAGVQNKIGSKCFTSNWIFDYFEYLQWNECKFETDFAMLMHIVP